LENEVFKLLLCIFIVLTHSVLACEFKIGVREYPPYGHKDNEGKWSGIDIEIFNYLMAGIKCEKEYIEVSFGQGVQLLKDGKLDGLSQMSITQDRLTLIEFIGPIRSETLTLITSNDVHETITTFMDITRLPHFFGKRKGTYIGEEFNTLVRNNQVFASKFIEMDNANPRIDLVLKGRVVGFFDEQRFNRYMMANSHKYTNMKVQPLKINNGLVHLGFSKKSISKHQLNELKKAFENLKASGTLEALINLE